MDADQKGPNVVDDPRLHMRAAMLFPSDQSKREAFIAGTIGRALGSILPELDSESKQSIPAEIAFAFGRATERLDPLIAKALELKRKIKGNIGSGIFPGEFAGVMLLLPLAALFQGKRIGRNAVYRAFCHGNDGARRTLQHIWAEYSPAAHLWAASLICDGLPEDEKGLLEFTCLAEFLRMWGTTFYPQNADEPLQPNTDLIIRPIVLHAVEFDLRAFEIDQDVMEQIGLAAPSGLVRLTSEGVFFASEP
ncbi:MAG: hypothetical protein ABSC25_17280 [Roseiarcus sp.]|jgi:hypothetical protein